MPERQVGNMCGLVLITTYSYDAHDLADSFSNVPQSAVWLIFAVAKTHPAYTRKLQCSDVYVTRCLLPGEHLPRTFRPSICHVLGSQAAYSGTITQLFPSMMLLLPMTLSMPMLLILHEHRLVSQVAGKRHRGYPQAWESALKAIEACKWTGRSPSFRPRPRIP